MENLVYEVEIEAPIEKVWELLWNNETYNAWTKFLLQIPQCVPIGKSVAKLIS